MKINRKQLIWLVTLPSVVAYLMIVLVPTLVGLYYSFTDWNGIGNNPNFVGLKNYRTIFTDASSFWDSFAFTGKFAVVAVLMVNVLGFALALMLTQKIKGRNFFRTVFFMPNLIGGVLLGFTWQFIFTSVFSAIAAATGISFFEGWLSNAQTGFWGLVIVVVWQLSGYMMIIYIAQLQNISDSVIEASYLDGATPFQRLRQIVIPLMWPAFTIGLFLTISNSFKLFDQNLTLTAGGPNNQTQMLALNIYNTAFKQSDLGLAQAKAVVFLIIVAAITFIQLSITKRKEVEM